MFENITVVGEGLSPSSNKEVDAAEQQLAIRFPRGYREYVTQFGQGILGGSYIRVYPPARVRDDLAEWRARIELYWLWDAGHAMLTKADALESVVIGDTADGDELIVHPQNPDRIYVLPRHKPGIFVAGDGLTAAIEWLCSAGVLTEAFTERDFEPY